MRRASTGQGRAGDSLNDGSEPLQRETASTQQPNVERPRVDYVVVTYRSANVITSCLDSIAADRAPRSEVFVVDNASPDDSAGIAAAHGSAPRVVANRVNRGFGRACNQAAELSDADLLFFVNPDARIRPGVTRGLSSVLRGADRRIVAAGPRVEVPGREGQAASAGFEPSVRSVLGHYFLLSRLPLLGRWFAPLQLAANSPRRVVDWVGGAALMVSRAEFQRVGGFDRDLFLYMEDVDLCRRLREAGGSIVYDPRWTVQHEIGGSQGREQGARWSAAFHDYVAGRRGPAYARLTSALAALGLGLRAVLGTLRGTARPRLRAAALAAMARAFGPASDDRRGV